MATAETREIAIIGLGRMGGGLALQALERGFRVVGVDPGGVRRDLVEAGLEETQLEGLRARLAPPRRVLLYVPAGRIVDGLLDELTTMLDPGDVIVDGGNSYWGDSIRRGERLAAHGLRFCDAGTSGGVEGARHGACFMVGGSLDTVELLAPVFRALSVEGGFVHAGAPGAGHFTKLVHNGIELGMLEAIGEGVDLLERSAVPVDVPAVLRCFRHGSVIRSWLMDLMETAYKRDPTIDAVPPYVDDTGEVNWLIGDALDLDVPVPIIAQAVMQLVASRDGKHIASRAVAMMRHGFGGHAFGPDRDAERARREGRVGDLHRH